MAKGKRPAQAGGPPWARWAGVVVGLAVVAGLVWFLTLRSQAEPEDQAATEDGGPAPVPLDVSGADEVDDSAIANVPPDSLVAAGPDAPRGVDVSNDPRLGAQDAQVTIVEFSDFQCPHCATFHKDIFPALQSLYGDRVRWYFVNRYYTAAHPQAEAAAIAAECAGRQNRFWQYADQVFRRQAERGPDVLSQIAGQGGLDTAAFARCQSDPTVMEELRADDREASRVRVEGTPTFFVNGQRIVGAQPVGVFNQIIGPYFQ